LVHDQAHQHGNNTVAYYVYLNGKQIEKSNASVINPGSKSDDEQDSVQTHPFFIAHDLRVVLETMKYPH
jgi:hypothetical protein